MIDPPTWEECLPRSTDHGYIHTATLEVRFAYVERAGRRFRCFSLTPTPTRT